MKTPQRTMEPIPRQRLAIARPDVFGAAGTPACGVGALDPTGDGDVDPAGEGAAEPTGGGVAPAGLAVICSSGKLEMGFQSVTPSFQAYSLLLTSPTDILRISSSWLIGPTCILSFV